MTMVMRPLRALLGVAAAALAVGGATTAQAAPSAGIDIGPAATEPRAAVDAQLDRAKALHVKIVRIDANWAALEPAASGQRDPTYVAGLDRVFASARARGLKVALVVAGTPCWASTAPSDVLDRCGQPGYRGEEAEAYPPANPARYGDVVGYLARRYASGLAALEIWNEPDHASQNYFKGGHKPQHYVELVKAAYPKAKAAAPMVPVLAGSLVGADGRFLKALYAAGMKGHYDGLSVHYYDLVLASLRSIRQVQKAAGDTKPLWLNEFGWTSCYPAHRTQGGHACVTPAVQASDLTDTFRALRSTSWVKSAVVYNLADTTQYNFGLTDIRGRLKPAYAALAKVLRGRPPAPRRPKLRLARRGGSVIASGSGPAADDLEVDAYIGGRLRYKAVVRLTRANTFSLKLPAELGTSGLKVRVWQYWTGRSATARI